MTSGGDSTSLLQSLRGMTVRGLINPKATGVADFSTLGDRVNSNAPYLDEMLEPDQMKELRTAANVGESSGLRPAATDHHDAF